MNAFTQVQNALAHATWPNEDVYKATKELVKAIERDADEVGFDVGEATEETAETLQEMLNELDEESENVDVAEDEEDDEEDELSGFGEDEEED